MRKYVCYDVFVGDTCNVEEFGNYRDALAYYKKQLAKNKDNKTIWIAGWKDTGGSGDYDTIFINGRYPTKDEESDYSSEEDEKEAEFTWTTMNQRHTS